MEREITLKTIKVEFNVQDSSDSAADACETYEFFSENLIAF